MSAVIRPRGPLPGRVYWIRRLLVVGTALALVFAVGSLLTRGSDGSGKSSERDRASLATQKSSPAAEVSATKARRTQRATRKASPKKPALPAPSGDCVPADVLLTPVVPHPVAGKPVRIQIQVNSLLSPACTFRVSSSTVTLKITSGRDEIWTSRECPAAITAQDVVARNTKSGLATIWWSARRSDTGCPKTTKWALDGWYHVSVAALSGEPREVQFQLRLPQPAVITKSPKPSPEPSRTAKPSRHSSPSGAVEPDGR